MLERYVTIWLILCGLVAAAFFILLLRFTWRLHRGERELNRGNCPACSYPLRFNGTEHWCSECGYKHPVKK